MKVTAGARFGPRAIRAASARQSASQGFGPRMGLNPYDNWAKMVTTWIGLAKFRLIVAIFL